MLNENWKCSMIKSSHPSQTFFSKFLKQTNQKKQIALPDNKILLFNKFDNKSKTTLGNLSSYKNMVIFKEVHKKNKNIPPKNSYELNWSMNLKPLEVQWYLSIDAVKCTMISRLDSFLIFRNQYYRSKMNLIKSSKSSKQKKKFYLWTENSPAYLFSPAPHQWKRLPQKLEKWFFLFSIWFFSAKDLFWKPYQKKSGSNWAFEKDIIFWLILSYNLLNKITNHRNLLFFDRRTMMQGCDPQQII